MDRRQQAIERGEITEDRRDIAVIGNVVTEIGHRRRKDRGEPDRIDAQRSDMIEAPFDPGEIADTVAVAVLKGARIDLIDGAALPPGLIGGVLHR